MEEKLKGPQRTPAALRLEDSSACAGLGILPRFTTIRYGEPAHSVGLRALRSAATKEPIFASLQCSATSWHDASLARLPSRHTQPDPRSVR